MQSKVGAGSSFNIDFSSKAKVKSIEAIQNLRKHDTISINFSDEKVVPEFLILDEKSYVFIHKKGTENKLRISLDHLGANKN